MILLIVKSCHKLFVEFLNDEKNMLCKYDVDIEYRCIKENINLLARNMRIDICNVIILIIRKNTIQSVTPKCTNCVKHRCRYVGSGYIQNCVL